MRHRKAGRKLGRTWEHRKALFRNLACALVDNERIKTTEAKAKELRKLSDRLVNYGLENTVHARRKAYRILEDRTLVKKLFDEIAPRFAERPGGYTRVVKLAKPRSGDSAPMAVVEFSAQDSAASSK
jgi:large subunit ribosomal protein L17